MTKQQGELYYKRNLHNPEFNPGSVPGSLIRCIRPQNSSDVLEWMQLYVVVRISVDEFTRDPMVTVSDLSGELKRMASGYAQPWFAARFVLGTDFMEEPQPSDLII